MSRKSKQNTQAPKTPPSAVGFTQSEEYEKVLCTVYLKFEHTIGAHNFYCISIADTILPSFPDRPRPQKKKNKLFHVQIIAFE
jgi:hypothetical protein